MRVLSLDQTQICAFQNQAQAGPPDPSGRCRGLCFVGEETSTTLDAGAPGARGAVHSLPSPRCCPGCLRPLQQPSQDQRPGSWTASPELYLLSTRPGRITDGQTCLGRKEGTLGAVAPKGPARRDPDPPRAWQGPGSPAQLCGSNQWRLPSPSLSSPPSLSLTRVTV